MYLAAFVELNFFGAEMYHDSIAEIILLKQIDSQIVVQTENESLRTCKKSCRASHVASHRRKKWKKEERNGTYEAGSPVQPYLVDDSIIQNIGKIDLQPNQQNSRLLKEVAEVALCVA